MDTTVVQEQPKEDQAQVTVSEKYTLRSHFDAVRSCHITEDESTLVTTSEDCMIKLWSLNNLKNFTPGKQGSTAINMEPFLTLRGHTGPILTSCNAKDLLFTGGIEGIVKGWLLPPESSITPYGESQPDA